MRSFKHGYCFEQNINFTQVEKISAWANTYYPNHILGVINIGLALVSSTASALA